MGGGGAFCAEKKNRIKKFDTRIRVQNSGVQHSFHRIRPQIRVPEVQNPLCTNLPLRLSFHTYRSCLNKFPSGTIIKSVSDLHLNRAIQATVLHLCCPCPNHVPHLDGPDCLIATLEGSDVSRRNTGGSPKRDSLNIGKLSGSHRLTHIASDLALRVLASQAKPQRESESQPFLIARS